ncbi:flagellar hook-basal body protein [Paenibacillus mucilaginosus]|uniref:Flagellar basal-body rod protein n=3 Tax=Paenibacillus mucilaginosus TaxID=61624 RepID=H6NT49_9BACL|nr:flagellar hook-basal body protein [Paenibacillus mucilaginosus]AEI38727.1 flagellar basal-body rod protein [Paenibacillus mucilaginosus KNP414]AFC27062.1 flagellar basal-body rod protein [Paenibacillus mucilaginosus 3016]AFH59195.1 flagellar basal body rod protein [Paenibacillus mucilaginosus K02]MCG7215863.1 flagellar hook-basal body protein [Paenibacillus mucilaginosus]WDM27811.1 flagellar hook-basal body protein [Paenibacillus mucilaginosus]
MLRGLYTAASGMIAQQRKHDIVTNNIANLNTPGFKGGNGINRSFPEVLIERTRDDNSGPAAATRTVGRIHTGVLAEENVSLHAQGDLQETNNPFDFALVSNIQVPGARFDSSGKYVDENGERVIQPQAFFTIQNAAGDTRYSLNGKFSLDVNGRMIDSEGNQVLGSDGQPIVLMDGNTPVTNFRITRDGQFTNVDGRPINGANGQPLTMMITRVEDPNLLIREGNGLYRLSEENQAMAQQAGGQDQFEVRQGFVERSNVDAGQSMVDMMSALRAYEANQKMIQFYDKSMEKAANDVGRV